MEYKKYYRVQPTFDTDYKIEELNLIGRNKNCFLSKKEAEKDFFKAQKIAIKKINQVLEGLQQLRKDLEIDFDFDYYMEGDLYGIYEDGLYISIPVNGYEFKFLQKIN